MFPFTLPGPQFLGFYAALAVVLFVAYAYYASRIGNSSGEPRISELTADPYRIVFLRADAKEAVRVAVVNLVDRGLLQWTGTTLVAKTGATDFARRPLDDAVLKACARPVVVQAVEGNAAVAAACAQYESELEQKGLRLLEHEREAIRTAFVVVVFCFVGIAVIRMVQALVHGQNFHFLAALAAFGTWVLWRLRYGPATPAGRRVFSSLKVLTERLKGRIHTLRAGGATNDALLLAAVHGIYVLPAAFLWVEQIFPKPKSDGSGCGSSGCGSSGCGGGGGCGGCGG